MPVAGEPGAGKSMLLEAWLEERARERPEPEPGPDVPVLVRLRALPDDDAPALPKETAPEKLTDRPRRHRLRVGVGIRETVSPFHSCDGRLWQPVRLLDGLDEPPETLLDERFLRRLAHLPGRVCFTCRTRPSPGAMCERSPPASLRARPRSGSRSPLTSSSTISESALPATPVVPGDCTNGYAAAPSSANSPAIPCCSYWLRTAVAGDEWSPRGPLARLTVDQLRCVRRDVAENPATAAEVLARLAADEEWHVRVGVATDPATLLEDLVPISD